MRIRRVAEYLAKTKSKVWSYAQVYTYLGTYGDVIRCQTLSVMLHRSTYILLNFNIFQALQRSTMYINAQKVEIIICL